MSSKRSSRRDSPEPARASSRYDDDFFGLLESTISDRSSRDRDKHSRSKETQGHGSQRTRDSSRDKECRRRRRSSERERRRSRSPRKRGDSPQKKKKLSFLEEMQKMYPDIRSEIQAREIESNMKALQMFGNPQPALMSQPNMFYPNFPTQDQYNMPGYYPAVNPIILPIMEVPHLPVEPVPAPMQVEQTPIQSKYSVAMNPEPPGSYTISSRSMDNNENSNDAPSAEKTPEIDIQSATKKAFEEGNIGLSDFLRQKVLQNKKKMEVTNIQVKKKQVVDRSKRALQMIEDVQKGKIILPLFFKPPSKPLPSLKQNQNLAKRSPLALSDTNLKFSWQGKSLDGFVSNPCNNISGELLTLARNVPMDLSELSQRAATRAKIEKNKETQAAKAAAAAQAFPIPQKPTIKRSNFGVQTDPLICISCDIRAKTLITTQGTQTNIIEKIEEAPVEPGTFKFQLDQHELALLNDEQRHAFMGFCKAFNMNFADFIEPEPLAIDLNLPLMPSRRSPSYAGRNESPPRRSRSLSSARRFEEQQLLAQRMQESRYMDFVEDNYNHRPRSGSPISPMRRTGSCAFERLGQKIPSDSPRNIVERVERPQRFCIDDNVVVISNDRFVDQPIYDDRSLSPRARHLAHGGRSRSPGIFRRLGSRSRSPSRSQQRYISPPRNPIEYDSPIRNQRDDYEYHDEADLRVRGQSSERRNFILQRSRSPIRMVNGIPEEASRNESPPPQRRRTPDRDNDYRMRRNDSPPPARPFNERIRNRSRSRSPRTSSSNWFDSSRREIGSGSSSGRLSSRHGRY